jgi:hypothetical protein
MMVHRGNLQFNVGYEPWKRPGILDIPEVLSLAEARVSISKKKNQQKYLTRDYTQDLLNECPVFYTAMTRSR